MYAWLFRRMPGPLWLRIVIAAVVAMLFTWVFPAIAPVMPFNGTTVGEDG